MSGSNFKTCTCCGKVWQTRDEFIKDNHLTLEGYQADLDSLEEGMLLFTHHWADCGSTIVLEVQDFSDLYDGPKYLGRLTLTEDCSRLCLDKQNLNRCVAMCECAYVRELLQIIIKHKAAYQSLR